MDGIVVGTACQATWRDGVDWDRHLAKVRVASSSLVIRSTVVASRSSRCLRPRWRPHGVPVVALVPVRQAGVRLFAGSFVLFDSRRVAKGMRLDLSGTMAVTSVLFLAWRLSSAAVKPPGSGPGGPRSFTDRRAAS